MTHSGSGNVHDEGGDESTAALRRPRRLHLERSDWIEADRPSTPADGNVFTAGAERAAGRTSPPRSPDRRPQRECHVASTSAVLLTVSVSGDGTSRARHPTSHRVRSVSGGQLDRGVTASPRTATFHELGRRLHRPRTQSLSSWTRRNPSPRPSPRVKLRSAVERKRERERESGAINGGANGNVCSANFPIDSTVTLTATPQSANVRRLERGLRWHDDDVHVLMSSAKSVTATFTPEVQLGDRGGNGNVSGGRTINCGNNGNVCTAHFVRTRRHAQRDRGRRRDVPRWSGACGGRRARAG